jgi:hypothetical protein
MQRRELVLGAMGMAGAMLAGPARAAAAGLPVPSSGVLDFQILRSGTPVGEHRLTFAQTGDQLRVDVNAAASGTVMGLIPFHYSCMATEHWSGGAFCGVDSKVNHNGTQLEVHAAPIAGGFAIQSTKAGNYNYTGQPAMLPLTYWNKAMLDAMILNIETGRHYPATVNSPGWFYLPTAAGGTVLAQRFDVTGKLHFSVWYDQYGQWAGLEFNIYGSELTLRKVVA